MSFSRPCSWPQPLQIDLVHAEDAPRLGDLPALADGIRQDAADTLAGIESDLGYADHFGADLTAESVAHLEAVRVAAAALHAAAERLSACVAAS
jgi:hypothetical protein